MARIKLNNGIQGLGVGLLPESPGYYIMMMAVDETLEFAKFIIKQLLSNTWGDA